MIEYFCSGQYSQGCEAGISPLAADIDWSLCDIGLKKLFDETVAAGLLITDKDKNGFSVQQWEKSVNSGQFLYGQL
jgi:hypothetical protein